MVACKADRVSERLVPGPALARTMVDRPRLVGLLDASPQARVASVVAPAGSGKSVLLGEWTADRPVAWLGIDRRHDDAVVFAKDLVAALAAVHPDVEPSIVSLTVAGGRRLGDAFVDALCDALASSTDRVVLVLDDLHHLGNPQIVDDLERLVDGLPDDAQVLIGSRWDPALRLGRLRLSDRLIEVRAADLAFDRAEGLELLQLVTERPVTEVQAEALVDRTEGWAAGLQLAALSMRRRDDLDEFIDGFTGDDRLVADYLTGEVLRSLEPLTRRFLLQTSVLEWLVPELCDAVTGDANGVSTMRLLVDQGHLVPVDGRADGRYRYHHLFADLLRYQLAAEDRAGEERCRRRAAAWLLGRGELRAGIEQYLALGDVDLAFELIATEGHQFFERGESATLVQWLTTIERRTHPTSPTVAINLLAAQLAGDEFDRGRETFRRIVADPALSPGERVAAQTLGALLGEGGLPTGEVHRMVGDVERLLSDVDRPTVVDFLGRGGADSCETIAGFASATAHFHDGDIATSVKQLEGVAELPGTEYPIWRTRVFGELGLCHAWQGRLDEAHRFSAAALDTARSVDALDHVSAVFAGFAMAIVSLDRLDPVQALAHLDAVAGATNRCRRPSHHHLLDIVRVRAIAATDGIDAALAELDRPGAPGTVHPVVARARLQLHARLLLRADAVDEAAALLGRSTLEAPAARIDTHLAMGDLVAARAVLDAWVPDETDLRSTVERRIRSAFVLQRAGRSGAAGTQIVAAAALAETEALLAPFADAPLALSLLRTSAPSRPLRHLRPLLESVPDPDRRATANAHLVESLTAREVGVLEYLPSRLTNSEIAEQLYISVNTLKTHLRSIYRKLQVDDRDDAVARASSLGLL